MSRRSVGTSLRGFERGFTGSFGAYTTLQKDTISTNSRTLSPSGTCCSYPYPQGAPAPAGPIPPGSKFVCAPVQIPDNFATQAFAAVVCYYGNPVPSPAWCSSFHRYIDAILYLHACTPLHRDRRTCWMRAKCSSKAKKQRASLA